MGGKEHSLRFCIGGPISRGLDTLTTTPLKYTKCTMAQYSSYLAIFALGRSISKESSSNGQKERNEFRRSRLERDLIRPTYKLR